MSMVRSHPDPLMKTLDFAFLIGKLKRVPRTGWIDHKVHDPESVAEHSYRMALLVMVLAPKLNIDVTKTMKIALIHDLAEAEIGDIVTLRGTKIVGDVIEKRAKEAEAMRGIAQMLEISELESLFREYGEQSSPEARIVKQLDRLEMLIQAYEYETEQKIDLEEFFIATRPELVGKEMEGLLQELEKRREQKD